MRHQKTSQILICLVLVTLIFFVGFLLGLSIGRTQHHESSRALFFNKTHEILDKVSNQNHDFLDKVDKVSNQAHEILEKVSNQNHDFFNKVSNQTHEILDKVSNLTTNTLDKVSNLTTNTFDNESKNRSAKFTKLKVEDRQVDIVEKFIHTWKDMNKSESCLDICLDAPINGDRSCHFVTYYLKDGKYKCGFGNFENTTMDSNPRWVKSLQLFLRKNSYGKQQLAYM